MERNRRFVKRYNSLYEIYLYIFWLVFSLDITSIENDFIIGKTDHSINEMDRLNGRMSPREAVIKCELDDECAGFTYHGPKTLWDDHIFQITFY